MYGGFVEWTVGSRDDGTDSIARQIAAEHHWPNLHVLILVVLYCIYFSLLFFTQNIICCKLCYWVAYHMVHAYTAV